MSRPVKTLAIVGFAAIVAVSLSACGVDPTQDRGLSSTGERMANDASRTETRTIAEIVAKNPDLDMLQQAISAAALTEELNGPGPYTLLAPTDKAFQALPGDTFQKLIDPQNGDDVRAVVEYHIIPGRYDSAAFANATAAQTTQGSQIPLNSPYAHLYYSKAHIIKGDIPAANGVIHIIDRVLAPPQS